MHVSKFLRGGVAGGVVAASALLFAPLAGAATVDGTVGTTSTGTVDVTITVPNLVLIQNLDAIFMEYIPTQGDISATEDFCIWATSGTLYDITISSGSGAGAFQAVSGAEAVTYSVEFSDVGTTSWEGVTEGTTLTNSGIGFTGASQLVPGCASDNVAVRVTAAEIDNLDAVTAGVYTDEMTLLVEAR